MRGVKEELAGGILSLVIAGVAGLLALEGVYIAVYAVWNGSRGAQFGLVGE